MFPDIASNIILILSNVPARYYHDLVPAPLNALDVVELAYPRYEVLINLHKL